ncbi:delta-1-pyrroline-5-carboxylate synthase-like [Macrobrachium nipponense]|uniref:delta-1-pyrroline-5-carboxylate synthase-like n=1 Tax=Macrobrachium nipponense TaxID=159736 RepID=UPI0030C844E3
MVPLHTVLGPRGSSIPVRKTTLSLLLRENRLQARNTQKTTADPPGRPPFCEPWYANKGNKGASLRVSLLGANRPRSLGLTGQSKLAVAKPLHSTSVREISTKSLQSSKSTYASLHLDASRSLSRSEGSRAAFLHRQQLQHARRIVVKLGSAVITRKDGYGLALGRLASIVEQVAELQNEGRELLMVTSGAVAFGKQKLAQELLMSLSMRETLSTKDSIRSEEAKSLIAPRASAAVGQSGLMSLYEAMFAQYGVKVAQILITKPDFYNNETRQNLNSTINELIALNILPIINTNDAVTPPPQVDEEISKKLDIRDNDSLAARLAVEIESDLIILMTDVDGIFNKPPTEEGARLIDNFCRETSQKLMFGEKSSVGTGGMESKVKAASWALDRGTSVVICNGLAQGAIKGIVQGRKIGTFFTNNTDSGLEVEVLTKNARVGSRLLQSLDPSQRAGAIKTLAELLETRQPDILVANQRDMEEAEKNGLSSSLMARLRLTPAKLNNLAEGLRQIAASSLDTLGRTLSKTIIAENIELRQVTVPIGVLLVIFESRPDCLPQVAALAMATGNGLLLKGGKEAYHSNQVLIDLVKESLSTVGATGAISLVTKRDEISDLLQLDGEIDLVIPRGSSELVRTIQEQSQAIPVLGHAEGICHVYVDKDADVEKAVKIVRDAKCDYPSACNAMETLLIHEEIFHNSQVFNRVCQTLIRENVKIQAGPRLAKMLTFGPPLAETFKVEFSDLECIIEVVSTMEEAIDHIHRFGSSHTDVIITEDEETADHFLSTVDSACVFHNVSSRFADGFRLGLGAEVGISTARIHARGPVGMEGLLTTKWVLKGDCGVASDFSEGRKHFIHRKVPVDVEYLSDDIYVEHQSSS